jgi:hypothetical protein
MQLGTQDDGGKLPRMERFVFPWPRTLAPGRFVGVHRSTIVHRTHVREMQSWLDGDYVLILRSGAREESRRGCRRAMDQVVKGARRGI